MSKHRGKCNKPSKAEENMEGSAFEGGFDKATDFQVMRLCAAVSGGGIILQAHPAFILVAWWPHSVLAERNENYETMSPCPTTPMHQCFHGFNHGPAISERNKRTILTHFKPY